MEYKVPDYKNDDGFWVKSFSTPDDHFRTKSSVTWGSMNTRCKSGGMCQVRQPTYIGCSMSDNFKDFQYFTDWYTEQIGYDFEDYHLDKDILVKGNKIYSEDICVLVPAKLNTFFISCQAARGVWPRGVSFHRRTLTYDAKISIDGNYRKHLGCYSNPEDASQAYITAKEAEGRRWYDRLVNKEFIVDDRVIEIMSKWTVN